MPENISLQSIIGKKGIPTPYIKKITLTPSARPTGMDMDFGEAKSPMGLLARVELCLTDLRKRKRFQWVGDERLQKYLRIRIIESRDPKLTEMLADGGFTSAKLKRAKRKYNFREKFLSLRNDRDIESVERYRQGKGVTVYMIPYEAEFFIPSQRPPHLAYFCSCYMDTRELTRDFGAKFKNRRFREVQGYVAGDIVISNGRPITGASVYHLSNGDIHPGAVHFQKTPKGGKYMAGPRHTQQPHPVLKRVQIPNFKVQDQRALKMLENLEFNLRTDDEVFDKVRKNFPKRMAAPPRHSKKPNFISNAFVSRDSDGKPNLVFSVDTRRILMEKGQFGKILSTENTEVFKKIADTSKILSFNLFRRRVRKNRLGSNPRSGYKRYDENTKRELIVRNSERIAGQFRRKVYKRDRIGDGESKTRIGFVKEFDLQNTSRLRTFSCTDFSMAKVTDGVYQYIVEIEMEDGTLEFVLDVLRKLKRNKRRLLRYYNNSQLPGNYNFNSNKFTKKFIDQQSERYPQLSDDMINNTPNLERQKENPRNSSEAPWNRAIVVMLESISALTNISSDNIGFIASNLHSMINPKTGTPEGLANFVDAYEKIEQKIRRLLGHRGTGETEFDVSVKSSIHKERFKKSTIKVRKRFKQVFNSDVAKGIEYDFLGGRKTNRGGMREITIDFYQNRLDDENSKYFSGPRRRSDDPLSDLRTAEYAYLTPARVKYGIKTLKILNSGKALWNRKRYNEATRVIASMRMDPTREELSAPVGTAKNFAGARGLKETLSRNILRAHGISIEPPRPRPPRNVVEKEEVGVIETEEIIGKETLSQLTEQALILVEEDFEEEAEILEEENTRTRRKFEPLNALFVERLINRDSSDIFRVAERKGVAPGLAGFNLQKSDNIYEKLFRDKPGMENKIRTLPNQIKSLFLSNRPLTINKWNSTETDFLLNSETFEMFRYNYFMLQRVEYLAGFETSDIDGRQVTKPIFNLMTPAALNSNSEKSLLCRMSSYKNTSVYADIPKQLRLPIRDRYFLIKFGDPSAEALEDEVTEAEEPLDRAARRLARTTSLDRTAHRIMQILLEKEGRAESYYQYATTIFIKQPRDLIQEGAEIKSRLAQSPPSPTTRTRRATQTMEASPSAQSAQGTRGSTGGEY
jgi:hypothetical protein